MAQNSSTDGSQAGRERLVAGFLVAVMVVGAAGVWIGVPLLSMWLAGELTESFGAHAPLALALILPGVILGCLALAWVNNVYLRVTGDRERVPDNLWRLQRSGPLDSILFVCFVIAVIALLVWFFAFAENPGRGVFGPGG